MAPHFATNAPTNYLLKRRARSAPKAGGLREAQTPALCAALKMRGPQALPGPQAGQPPGPAVLAAQLEPEVMGHLASLLQKPEDPARREQAMADYIGVIRAEYDKRQGGGAIDPLLAAKDKFKNKMGYGGKHSG